MLGERAIARDIRFCVCGCEAKDVERAALGRHGGEQCARAVERHVADRVRLQPQKGAKGESVSDLCAASRRVSGGSQEYTGTSECDPCLAAAATAIVIHIQ